MRIPAHRPDALLSKPRMKGSRRVGLGTGQGLLADTSAFAGGTVADGRIPDPTFVRGL
jgi:hypothetical protein